MCWKVSMVKTTVLFTRDQSKTCNFIKKETRDRCFPVNFVKFLRNLFLQNTSGGCFWSYEIIFYAIITDHYSFNKGLSKCTFSTYYYGKQSFAFLCFMCFLSIMSFELDVIFIGLQHLYNHCLWKCHLVFCDFVLTL